MRTVERVMFAGVLALGTTLAGAQTVAPFFAGSYSAIDLGTVPGVPPNYGGLTFLNNDTMLLGGSANTLGAKIYAVPVIRNGDQRIVSFGTPTEYANANGPAGGIDGGLAFGPAGVLFYTTFSDNHVGQIKPGSTGPDKLTHLTPLGVTPSTGALQFVPAGMPGAGKLKIVSYSTSRWYSATVTPDGNGTFDINLELGIEITIGGGPEGIVYVPTGSVLFDNPAILISEYGVGRVSTFDVDANGDPIFASRRDFVTGLDGAEGAVIDPVTGDFLFSTFGGGNRIIQVTGFAIPEPSSLAFMAPMLMLGLRRR